VDLLILTDPLTGPVQCQPGRQEPKSRESGN